MLEPPNPTYPPILRPPEIEIRVWENDFGCPSVDPDCLFLMTLLKIYNIRATFTQSYFPIFCDIPSLRYNDVLIPRGSRLLSYIMDNIIKEREKFTTEHLDRIELFTQYFIYAFAETFLFDCWLNKVNFTRSTEVWFKNVIPFPFSHKYILRKRNKILKYFINVLRHRNPDRFMLKSYRIADRCLTDFAGLLVDGRIYIYNNTPTSLDAIIYSYLTIALHMPLQHCRLQELVKQHFRLVRYCRIITLKHFPGTQITYKHIDPPHLRHPPASTATMILAAAVTSTAMVSFAMVMGVIEPRIPDFIRNIELSTGYRDMVEYVFESILLPLAFLIM